MTLSILQQNPRDPAFAQNPYPTYQAMHAAGGTVWWDEYSCVVFAKFADLSAILRDRRFGRTPIDQPMPPDHLKAFYSFEARSMLELEGAVHRALRKPVTRAFVNRRIDALRPAIETLAHGLIDKFVDQGEADLLPAYCEPIPVITIAQLLGLEPRVASQLLSWSHDMVAMYQFGGDRNVEDRAEAATQAFTAFIAEQIEQRQVKGRDDLLTHLMAPDETGARLAKDDIIATSILILNAGHEATVHALGNGVKSLLQTNMRPEPAEETAEEILRFDPPLHMFMRFVYEDMIFGGVPLKRGQQVGLSLGAATRDPDRFENPEQFNPNRADAGHVSFGAGAHFCLGAALARLEMQVALPVLFDRLPKLRLAAQPRYADRYHFRGLEQLEVAWT